MPRLLRDEDRSLLGRELELLFCAGDTATAPCSSTSEGHPPVWLGRQTRWPHAAREFLADVDAYDWEASYAATGSQFRSRNTLRIWSDASDQVRIPLGAVAAREATGYQEVYAPPNGYRVVTFRTDFSAKPDAKETVTLERENGAWRVVSYVIE